MTAASTAPPERVGFIRQLGVDTVYVLVGFPLATVGFVVAVTGISAGLGTLVIVVGVPVLAATLLAGRLFADLERLRLPAVLHRPASRPAYRISEPGVGVWKRIVNPLRQTQSWLDLLHCIAHFPIAVATFCIVVAWWAAALGGTSNILWDWAIPRGPDNNSLAELIGLGDSAFARIGLQTAIGLICLITLPAVVRGCALVSAAFSRALLTSLAEMRETITRADRPEGCRGLCRGDRAAAAGTRYPRWSAATACPPGDGPRPSPAAAGQRSGRARWHAG
ncbi:MULTISPECIES: sensor domain-containing protein [Mycolicibacterium]|uniref:sensor domain-containing protein n=1 Tax=Mycolicibacterium TaxID=1866885 RepID=UPI001F3A84C2|nr:MULTISPECIES: sensor domain-containing protein [Mycolicibacterium]